ncbi:flippase [Candidatus Falkowbacteria bacterium]|nr:flippase [Candidatus Falkowbacteria bacterium]
MTLNKQIAQNSIIQLFGKLVSLALGLIAVAIMTRYLGQEKFGYYTTVIAFLQFFGIMVDFGLSLATIQMISKPNVDLSKTMNAIMSFRTITAALFLLLGTILVWFFPYNIFIKLGVLITVLSFFCMSLIQTVTGVFQQKLKVWEITIAEVIGRIVLVGLTFWAVLSGKNIYWIFGAISAANIVNLAIVWAYSKKYINWRWQIDWEIWRDIIRRTWPMALSISFNLIYLKMDTIILSLTRTQAEVGLYGATYRVVDVLTMLPAVFMGIVIPVISRYYHENNREALKNILQKAFDALMIFAVPIVIGTFVAARGVMVLVAGNDFALSGEILKVLILASGAIFGTSLFGYAIVGIEKQRTIMWCYLTTAALTFVGYLLFIPKYGVWGAGWMTVFSEVMVMIWSAVVLYRTLKFFPSLLTTLKAVLAAMIMFFVLYVFRDWHVIWLLIISGAVYFPLLYLFSGVKKEMVAGLLKRE